MLWELDDLAGASDIAHRYMVGKATISNWAARYPEFPRPLAHIGGKPVYSRAQVHDWWKAKIWYEHQQGQKKRN